MTRMDDINLTLSVGTPAAGDDEANEKKRRTAYGRGFFDAAKAAGIDMETLMNEAKLQRAEQALSAIEQKVYDCIPTEGEWNRHQIMTELTRKTGTHCDARVVDGCIGDLLERKLIREPAREMFQRVAVKPRVFVMPKDKSKANNEVPREPVYVPPPTPLSASATMEKLGDLSKRLRAFADEVDAVALGVAEQLQKSDAEAENFRKMKALLGNVQ